MKQIFSSTGIELCKVVSDTDFPFYCPNVLWPKSQSWVGDHRQPYNTRKDEALTMPADDLYYPWLVNQWETLEKEILSFLSKTTELLNSVVLDVREFEKMIPEGIKFSWRYRSGADNSMAVADVLMDVASKLSAQLTVVDKEGVIYTFK
jgi:hypothetical protein